MHDDVMDHATHRRGVRTKLCTLYLKAYMLHPMLYILFSLLYTLYSYCITYNVYLIPYTGPVKAKAGAAEYTLNSTPSP
jgi:hypothetical protein